ncbi:hypothetical protein R3P38DRAFT_3170338 [Favolaschia claudopus]|uniref:Uncharacterized protein n=1 Tax=Favolaschia claudopus TaxID=2862362 RepID=A0AAW0DW20_9AGAR
MKQRQHSPISTAGFSTTASHYSHSRPHVGQRIGSLVLLLPHLPTRNKYFSDFIYGTLLYTTLFALVFYFLYKSLYFASNTTDSLSLSFDFEFIIFFSPLVASVAFALAAASVFIDSAVLSALHSSRSVTSLGTKPSLRTPRFIYLLCLALRSRPFMSVFGQWIRYRRAAVDMQRWWLIDPPTCVDLDLAPIIESVIPSVFHSMDTHHPSLTSDHFTITRSDLPRAFVILSPVVARPPRLASEGRSRRLACAHLFLFVSTSAFSPSSAFCARENRVDAAIPPHPPPAPPASSPVLIPSQTHLRALASPSPGINAPEDSTSPTVNPYRHAPANPLPYVRPRVRVVGGSGGEARGGDWGVLALLHCWNGVV